MGLIITLDLTYLCNGPVNFISYLQIKEMTHSDYDILFLNYILKQTTLYIFVHQISNKRKLKKGKLFWVFLREG